MINILQREDFRFNEDEIAQDLENLKNFYKKSGFLDVKIKQELRKKNDKYYIEYKINENKPVLVSKTQEIVTGSELFSIQEIISKIDFELKKGKRFQDKFLLEDIGKISKELNINGYIKHNVQYELDLDREKNSVEVMFLIETGKQYKFGKTKVLNNNLTKSKFYIDNLRYKSGQVFSFEKLTENERKFQNLSISKYITIEPNLSEIEDEFVPVEIYIKEHPLMKGKFGIGYGLVNRYRFSFKSNHYYLINYRSQFSFFSKHSLYRPYDTNLQFTYLAFPSFSTDLINRYFLLYEREDEYRFSHYGSSIGLKYNLSKNIKTQINYIFEKNKIRLKSDDSEFNEKNFYNKSSINANISINKAYPIAFPSEGYSINYAHTTTGLALGSKYHYFKNLISIKLFLTPLKNLTFANRIKLGSIINYHDKIVAPIQERFFGGGANSIRGWNRREISPRDDDGVKIGGNTYLEGTTEIRFPIYKNFAGVLFYDIGNVYEEEKKIDLENLKQSAGIGFRTKTALGTIRLDLARKLNNTDTKTQFYLNLGEVF